MIYFRLIATAAALLTFCQLTNCHESCVPVSLELPDSDLPIGEILASRFKNPNLITLPENEALWDILRLPKDSIANSQIIDHLLGVFGSDENQWFFKWILEKKAFSKQSRTFKKVQLKVTQAQILHSLKMKEYQNIRDILRKHESHKAIIAYYYQKDEVEGYANYLLDQMDSSLDSEDLNNFIREFGGIEFFFYRQRRLQKLF